VDPLLEALRFGLTVLASAFAGGVVAQRIAFRYGKKLQERQELVARQERAANVKAELRENLEIARSQRSMPLHRTAWDAGRGLPWPEPAFTAIREAYLEVDSLNEAREARTRPLPHGVIAALGSGGLPDRGPVIAAIEMALRAFDSLPAKWLVPRS
jgi:hypothetical protein